MAHAAGAHVHFSDEKSVMSAANLWDALGAENASIYEGLDIFEALADAIDSAELCETNTRYSSLFRLINAVNVVRAARDTLDGCVANPPGHPAHLNCVSLTPALAELDQAMFGLFSDLCGARSVFVPPMLKLEYAAREVDAGRARPLGMKVVSVQ
jgi:hypothetical protein